MIHTRKLLQAGSLLMVSLMLAVLISACSMGPSDPHTITFWTTRTGTVDMGGWKKIIAGFEKANPGYHVKLVGKPSPSQGDATALITAVRGGTPPDVFEVDRFTVSQYASIGLLSSLQPLIEKEGGKTFSDQYFPFAWKETMYQGESYALPFDSDARGLYYNKKLLREAGIDPSILDPKNGPPTIDEIMEISRKLVKKDSKGNYTQLGLIPWDGEASPATWGLSMGAKYYDPTTCEFTAFEPAFKKAFENYAKWSKELDYHKVDTFMATYQPPNAPPSETPFFTGHLGMSITGNWLLSSIRDYAPKLDYGITYLPVGQKGDKPFTWAGGYALVMPKGVKNVDGAWKLMQYIAGPEGQRIYSLQTQHLPTLKSLIDDPEITAGNQKFFASMMPFTLSRPPMPVGAQIWDAMDTAKQAVLLGDSTPQQALQNVYDRVQPQLQQFCPFQLP